MVGLGWLLGWREARLTPSVDWSGRRVLVEKIWLPCDIESVLGAVGVSFAVHVYCFLETTIANVALVVVSMEGWMNGGHSNPGADHV